MRSLSGNRIKTADYSLILLELMIIIADESNLAGDACASPAEKYYDYADYDCGDAPSPCCSGR